MNLLSLIAQAGSDTANKDAYLLWGFILAAASIGILFLELIVPSGGLLGLLCGVAAIASIVAFFQYDMTFGLAALLAYLVLGPIVIVFAMKMWIHSGLGRTMVLGNDVDVDADEEGEAASAVEKARAERLEQLRQLIGAEGMSETALRPVGFVKINGQRLDAMAQSGVIEAGVPVVVVDVYDNQIKVRAS